LCRIVEIKKQKNGTMEINFCYECGEKKEMTIYFAAARFNVPY